jgi:hypothetical protein
MPVASAPSGTAELRLETLLPRVPTQQEVERDLAQYEHYVANREQLRESVGMQTGGDR